MTEILDYIFLLFLVFLVFNLLWLICGIPISVSVLIYKWSVKKNLKYIGIVIPIVFFTYITYNIYTAIYPANDFYFDEFKQVTLRQIPKSAKIINKTASYPDFHGDYCSASLIELSSKDYEKLLNEIANDKRINASELISSSEFQQVMGNRKSEDIIESFKRNVAGESDHHLYIGFLNDKKTIIVHVCVT